MSSPDEDEGSVWGAGSHPEGGEQAGGLGHTLGTSLPSIRGRGVFPHLEGFEDEREVMEGVLWGCEGRPGSPADLEGDDTLDCLVDEAAAILQQLTDRDRLGVRRNPSPESSDSEVSTLWVDLQAGPGGRSARAYGSVGSRLPPTARLPLMGPGGGRAWGNLKRGAKARSKVTVGRQRSSAEGLVRSPSDSESESSDDFSELPLQSLSLCSKRVGQAKPRSLQDTPRHSSTHIRETVRGLPGSFLTPAPQQLASVGARRAVGELDVSRRKPQSVIPGKAGSRPSYLPGAAAAGRLPKATPGRKVAQEKKFLGGDSKVAPQGTFPSWGQRVSAAALEPATLPPVAGGPGSTFPPVTCGPVLGRGKDYSLVPLGTKQPRHTGAGQKSGTRRKKGSLPVVIEGKEPGKEPERDPGPKVQVSMRPWSSPLPTQPCTSLGMLPLSLLRACHWAPWVIRMPGLGGLSQGKP